MNLNSISDMTITNSKLLYMEGNNNVEMSSVPIDTVVFFDVNESETDGFIKDKSDTDSDGVGLSANDVQSYSDLTEKEKNFLMNSNVRVPVDLTLPASTEEPDYFDPFNPYSLIPSPVITETVDLSDVLETDTSVEYDENPPLISPNPLDDAESMDKLTMLARSGQIDSNILNNLYLNGKIPQQVSMDIAILEHAYANGINPIDAFVPAFGSLEEGISQVGIGDVFEVQKNGNINIKTADGASEELQIDKETYFKLFPPVERFASCQGNIGNCWELTALNSVMADPKERVNLLKMFKQDGNDIVVAYPNGNIKVRFKGGVLPDNANPDYYSSGADGMKLLEYTDGKEMQYGLIQKYMDNMNAYITGPYTNDKIQNAFDKLEAFTNAVDKNPDDLWIYYDENNEIQYCSYDEALNKGIYNAQCNNQSTALRDIGHVNSVWNKMGYDETAKISVSSPEFTSLLSDSDTFEKYLVAYSTAGKSNQQAVLQDSGLYQKHAYRVNPVISNDGTINSYLLVNPWGVQECELTLNQLEQYGLNLYVAKK